MYDVYPPSEDTFLLLDTLKKEDVEGKSCLEIGVGSGAITEFLSQYNTVDGVDINSKAIEVTRKKCENANIFYSDLFSHIDKTYDVIVFNPPYVPEKQRFDHMYDRSWYGGENGRVVIDRFLAEFDDFLNLEGCAYLLQSSLSDPLKTLRILKQKGFISEILARKKLFFEELTVIKSRREKYYQW